LTRIDQALVAVVMAANLHGLPPAGLTTWGGRWGAADYGSDVVAIADWRWQSHGGEEFSASAAASAVHLLCDFGGPSDCQPANM
jgi:hypothetical protein